jgi:hypothetical protein
VTEVKKRKRKKPRFRAVKEVKAIARERVGAPPSEKVIPDPRTKPEKHPKRVMANED